MRKRLYIAYGSNMNLPQMARRCPTAKVVGAATLEDYRLLFRGGHESAVATVEPHAGGHVPVLVWDIRPEDEDALDHYEGWPILYRKEMVTIHIKGRKTKVMVYIMNDGRPLGQPSCYYYSTILEGYKSAGLDTAVLRQATIDSAGGEATEHD